MASLHQGQSRYSGRGRGDGKGEARRKRQRNGGAFNQHPLVRSTRHRRNKWTGEGKERGRGVLSGSAVTAAEEPSSSPFPCLELGLFRRLLLLLGLKERLHLFKEGQTRDPHVTRTNLDTLNIEMGGGFRAS